MPNEFSNAPYSLVKDTVAKIRADSGVDTVKNINDKIRADSGVETVKNITRNIRKSDAE